MLVWVDFIFSFLYITFFALSLMCLRYAVLNYFKSQKENIFFLEPFETQLYDRQGDRIDDQRVDMWDYVKNTTTFSEKFEVFRYNLLLPFHSFLTLYNNKGWVRKITKLIGISKLEKYLGKKLTAFREISKSKSDRNDPSLINYDDLKVHYSYLAATSLQSCLSLAIVALILGVISAITSLILKLS